MLYLCFAKKINSNNNTNWKGEGQGGIQKS